MTQQPIRDELIGDSICSALGTTVNGNTRFTFGGAPLRAQPRPCVFGARPLELIAPDTNA
jgi:hypothetical protein